MLHRCWWSLKKEAAISSETSTCNYQPARRQIQGDSSVNNVLWFPASPAIIYLFIYGLFRDLVGSSVTHHREGIRQRNMN
jgi:hypothetical protein